MVMVVRSSAYDIPKSWDRIKMMCLVSGCKGLGQHGSTQVSDTKT